MSIVIAIDAGTTGVRAVAVDHRGTLTGWSYREFTQHFPRPGWVEHDADEIWSTVQTVLAELTGSIDVAEVAAIGITNQRETAVAWSRRTGRPLHRAIVWQDRRTAPRCAQLEADGHLPLVRERTGLVLDPYLSGTKFAWMLDEGGVATDDDLALGTVDSWVLWNLTGGRVHATEVSNASRTMVFDVVERRWSPQLADLLGVPLAALPEVRPSSGRFGTTAVGLAGLPAGIPISGIAGDQQAALFGQACFEVGMTKNTYGTGSFVLMNVGQTCPPVVDGLLTTVAWQLDPAGPATYAYEGAIFATGAAVQWLRDGLGIIDHAAQVNELAATVDDADGVYLVPAFTGLGAPWWDPHARGTIVGLTRGTTRAHIARAVIDAITYRTRDVVEAMAASSGHPVAALRADGGASASALLLQLQADQLQVPVARPSVAETTALGAAYLAGLAEGVWGSLDDVAANWRLDLEVAPRPRTDGSDAGYRGWLRAVARSRDWAEP